MRLYEDSCKQHVGKFHTLFDKSWLSGKVNDPTNVYNCNEKFYRILRLGIDQNGIIQKDVIFIMINVLG